MIRHIPDDLWNEVKNILPAEKPIETIGRPIVPFRKVLDGILYVLRTGCQWKMLPKERYGSGSTCHRRFQEWVSKRRVFEKLWIRLLEIYDDIRGIEWEWQQSLDSVSVKAPLGGIWQVPILLIEVNLEQSVMCWQTRKVFHYPLSSSQLRILMIWRLQQRRLTEL